MEYKNYQVARDGAWGILLKYGIHNLPVKVTRLCKQMGIAVTTYQKGAALLTALELGEHAKQTDGFTVQLGDKPIIFYDGECIPARNRFTIAHELGHIVLGHLETGRATALNREPDAGDDPKETAANIFAARLLAPACVIWALQLHTADEIAATCQISHQAAAFRAERMRLLYEREQTFLRERGKSCFLQSPMERELYHKFQDYIANYKSI